MAEADDRGFDKTDLVTLNPANPNPQSGVHLVDRDSSPRGLELVDPDRSGKKTQYDLVELAQQIKEADSMTRATASGKLQVIAEQVRFLQEQAKKILEEAKLNSMLNHTSCNFKKIPGKIYYIYKQTKDPEKEFISMISPEEWGSSGPEFVSAYKLEYDMSWTPVSEIEKKSRDQAVIDRLLDSGPSGVSLTFLPSQYQARQAIGEN